MKVLVNYLHDDRKTITESVLYDSTELDHILTEGDLAVLNNGNTIEMVYEGVPCTLSLFTTYVIVRFYQDINKGSQIIRRGLTLDQAQAHCSSDDTKGDGWFDGYQKEEMK